MRKSKANIEAAPTGYSFEITKQLGLDPRMYDATVIVVRKDEGELSKEDLALFGRVATALEGAALVSPTAHSRPRAKRPAAKRASKTPTVSKRKAAKPSRSR